MDKKQPLIFDIARGSFEDGPGVRTTIFFKGCPLTCPWCHNPESQSYNTETMFFPEDCIGCKNCENDKPCFSLARRTVGQSYSPDQLINILLEDKPFYDDSKGGVTFSGGEAFSFPHYLSQVLPVLKDYKIHVAFQTCGYFNFSDVCLLLPYIDLIYFDLKIMDSDTHKKWIGKPNTLILDNFSKLFSTDVRILPRIALIPGFVATRENLDLLARFYLLHDIKNCEFLFYHPGGNEKRKRLNKSLCKKLPEKPLSESENMAWIEYFKGRIL
ncbi:MAG: radical SAM protein [Desulfobacteraceae bacterium]|nr:radical SAM protein [Desulfobacteraceae bacterium]